MKKVRKKARTPEKDHSDRWLLTYADMITLLLGLFIILYSISKVDQQKLKEVSGWIRGGFGLGGVNIFESEGNIPDDDILVPRTQLYRLWERISYAVRQLVDSKRLNIGITEQEEIKVILFGPSLDDRNWQPDEDMSYAFEKIADLSKNENVEIVVSLQIPNQPAKLPSRFQNAWEYNAYRAAKIADLLVERYKVPSEKLSVRSFPNFRSVDGAKIQSPEDEATQERIEVTIRKKETAK